MVHQGRRYVHQRYGHNDIVYVPVHQRHAYVHHGYDHVLQGRGCVFHGHRLNKMIFESVQLDRASVQVIFNAVQYSDCNNDIFLICVRMNYSQVNPDYMIVHHFFIKGHVDESLVQLNNAIHLNNT